MSVACGERELCVEPLSATAGSDTSIAVAAAIDSLNRAAAGGISGKNGWVATGFVKRAGDTVEVGAGQRCGAGLHQPSASVLVVLPARVVQVFIPYGW